MYYVSLKQFEGPLDLLLHLITRAKVDIKDIFVSEITEQYLASMGSVDELDMDTASEFLTMAATLLEIKSRALLPRPPEPAEDGEETPEQTLIRRLEEYKLYKESAGRMKEFEQAAMQVFSKLPEEYPLPPQAVSPSAITTAAANANSLCFISLSPLPKNRSGPPPPPAERPTTNLSVPWRPAGRNCRSKKFFSARGLPFVHLYRVGMISIQYPSGSVTK